MLYITALSLDNKQSRRDMIFIFVDGETHADVFCTIIKCKLYIININNKFIEFVESCTITVNKKKNLSLACRQKDSKETLRFTNFLR